MLLKSKTGGFGYVPTPEGKNLPSPDDEERAVRENKAPDFQWTLFDPNEDDSAKGAHSFVVECKILGKPKRSDWIYNENYVKHGILRFVTKEHGYAKNEKSGAMVGYVYDMEPDSILAEINVTVNAYELPDLPVPYEGWQEAGVTRMVYTVARAFPIERFTLHHFWIDLRPFSNLADPTLPLGDTLESQHRLRNADVIGDAERVETLEAMRRVSEGIVIHTDHS